MTPTDLVERHAIHQRRETREWERTAWLAHTILGAWVKNPPDVDELLGRTKKA